MSKHQIQCEYCGAVWWEQIFLDSSGKPNEVKCNKCGDKNVFIKDPDKIIDLYKGCPPFPNEKLEPCELRTDEVKLEDPPTDEIHRLTMN